MINDLLLKLIDFPMTNAEISFIRHHFDYRRFKEAIDIIHNGGTIADFYSNGLMVCAGNIDKDASFNYIERYIISPNIFLELTEDGYFSCAGKKSSVSTKEVVDSRIVLFSALEVLPEPEKYATKTFLYFVRIICRKLNIEPDNLYLPAIVNINTDAEGIFVDSYNVTYCAGGKAYNMLIPEWAVNDKFLSLCKNVLINMKGK